MIVTEVDSFVCRVPLSDKAAAHGVRPEIPVTRVTTDTGLKGYEFAPTPARHLVQARRLVIGHDPHHVERFIEQGTGPVVHRQVQKRGAQGVEQSGSDLRADVCTPFQSISSLVEHVNELDLGRWHPLSAGCAGFEQDSPCADDYTR